MKTARWMIILIGFVAIIFAGGSAWANGPKNQRRHPGPGYHGGQPSHGAPQHRGPASYRPNKPGHQGHVHRPQAYRHPQNHRPHHHHNRYRDHRPLRYQSTGGYLFSASILDPGFVLGFISGAVR